MEKYEKISPARPKIRERYRAYRGGNGRPRISSTVRNEIRKLFESYPLISSREVASEKGVAHATVCNILGRELRLFPYKLQMSTALTEDHIRSRFWISRYCRQQLRNDNDYLEWIFFFDECNFSLSGQANNQNCRIWRTKLPNEVYETLHNSPSVMIWCAISKNGVIGPYFFEN